MVYRFVGVDKAGIARVFGQSENPSLAYREVLLAIQDYVRGRPDTGPASTWLIEDMSPAGVR